MTKSNNKQYINMENKKQTAVEWLVQQLIELDYDLRLIPNHIEHAKQMEKQQIIDAYDDGANERHNEPVNGEQYCSETYGS